MSDKIGYTDKLAPDRQIQAEEMIATLIYDHDGSEVSQDDASEMGRNILYHVLREFRPDLFEGAGICPHGTNTAVDFCLDCINEMYNRMSGGKP